MSKLKISEGADENYLATIVVCPKLEPHPNAERLSIVKLFGGNVIVGKDSYLEGEALAYFPIESSLSGELLSWANLFDDPAINADGKTKGFFSAKGRRVKPIRLRGIASEGFLLPVAKLAEFYEVAESEFVVGKSFDFLGEKEVLRKWVSGAVQAQTPQKKVKLPKWLEMMPRPIRKYIGGRFYNRKDEGVKSMIVPRQWNFHYSTRNLGQCFFNLKPDDDITITDKWHGTSFCVGRVLWYKQRSFWQKLFCISNEKLAKEYKLTYSSRTVLKNKRDGNFTDDVYGLHAEEVSKLDLPDGIILYGEIVGSQKGGKMVQKNYDYGYEPCKSGFHVYRITKTSAMGEVYEYSYDEIIEFCSEYGLKTVPIFWRGIAKTLFPEIAQGENWAKNFVEKLSERFLEKQCSFCKNKVPSEGIVLRVDSQESRPVFKHKSFMFKERESKDRDKGESNIEDAA